MFYPLISNIGGVILSELRYYDGIRNNTKTVEVRLFENMRSYRYTHLLMHPGRKYRKQIQTNLLVRIAGMTSPFGTAIEAFQYALRNGLDLCMNLKKLETKMT